ncbi:MAG: hypothetical protein AAGU32_15500 [Bacillota bacterium]
MKEEEKMVNCEALSGTLLKSFLDGFAQENPIVTGGHFMVTNKERLNSGTIDSFSKAVQTFKLLDENGVHVSLGVFINDIGLACSGTDSCSLEKIKLMNGPALPDEYTNILIENGIEQDEVVIISERFLRNRAKRIFHQVRKRTDAIIERDEGYYFLPKDRPEIILTRKNPHDKYGTPACPLIMGAYCLELKRMGYSSSINYYYVGSDNLSNIPNYLPIEKGRLLAHEIDPSIKTENIYLN